MFRKIDLKSNYTSEEDNLYTDFFIPTLTESVTYRRAVGFFSLGVLLNAPSAMSKIVESQGRIELIFGKLVSIEDFEAIQSGSRKAWNEEDFPSFPNIIEDHEGTLLEFRIRLLSWLFSSGRLEMKVALRPKGMFHQKIGLIEDRIGDTISFSGSMNETMSALDPRFNSEEISIFRSWVEGQQSYVHTHKTNFTKLWKGDTGSSTVICSLPEAIQEGLNFVAQQFPDRPTSDIETERARAFFEKKGLVTVSKPSVPKELNGSPFSIGDHQLGALRAWKDNNFNGILELATGAGKTITAIYGATETIKLNEGIALIIAVPYRDLADQWCKELKEFNINAIRCYDSKALWEEKFKSYLRRNKFQQNEFIALVVVNKTLKSDHFQALARNLDPQKMFFIGDECHHHGGTSFSEKLFPTARFRIGLSATPYHYLDDEANRRLDSVYDRTVFKYTLAQAVEDKVLTPYEYHPIAVELTPTEAQDYSELSEQIARIFASKKKEKGRDNLSLKMLLMRRARLVGAAENKLVELDKHLKRHPVGSHTLFYCSDGKTLYNDDDIDIHEAATTSEEMKQRFAVAKILMSKGISASPFTSDENREQRREILNNFKIGSTHALVAIRCLDEGIDVPACSTAYLIASSRNPRQFIQRRGRILRRAPNKDKATIYDFVVVIPDGEYSRRNLAEDFLRNELERVADFARHSLYPTSAISPLLPWLRKYDLEHLAT